MNRLLSSLKFTVSIICLGTLVGTVGGMAEGLISDWTGFLICMLSLLVLAIIVFASIRIEYIKERQRLIENNFKKRIRQKESPQIED